MSADLYRIVVRWDGLNRKGFIKIGDFTRNFSKQLTWFRVFDLWYIPEAHHLEVREDPGGPKRELETQELAKLAMKVREIGAIIRPIDDML